MLLQSQENPVNCDDGGVDGQRGRHGIVSKIYIYLIMETSGSPTIGVIAISISRERRPKKIAGKQGGMVFPAFVYDMLDPPYPPP